MTIAHCIAMVALFVLICSGGASGQTKDVIESETAPPKLVMLVYQRFPFDKATESGKALAAAARACANLDVPNSWIVLESVTEIRKCCRSTRSIHLHTSAKPSLGGTHLRCSRRTRKISSPDQ
jgi:hypothetical protein